MQKPDPRSDHDFAEPISNGPNARPRDEPIGQTGPGLPDDSSKPPEITDEEEAAIAEKLLGKR